MTEVVKYPLFFMDGTCVACGAKRSVKEMNKFGNENRNRKLYSTMFMKCDKCGREYMIRWDDNGEGEYNLPIAVSFNDIDLYVRVMADDLKSSQSQ